jgi:hypothetical protein
MPVKTGIRGFAIDQRLPVSPGMTRALLGY